MSERTHFALRFISGKYQGGEFPLKMDRELVIGRSSDLDMVLVEDMVSRKHAKISTMNDQVTIQDLGSTNGTFVNGERIKRVRLREGDRILIGTSIIKLVGVDASRTDANASERLTFREEGDAKPTSTVSPKRTVSARSMSGSIDEIPLPDLLQLLSTSKKSGVLEVQAGDDVGRIYMRKGQIYYATINDAVELDPHKAVYRILVWQSGSFELQPPDEQQEFSEELNEPTEALLMEAMRQFDEISRIREALPADTAKLRLATPLEVRLRDLSPEQLDVLQLVHNCETLRDVLDKGLHTDLETCQAIVELIKSNMISVD